MPSSNPLSGRPPLFTATTLIALSLFTAFSSFLLFRYFSPSSPSTATRRRPLPPLPRRPPSLRHAYFLIRHAQSTANVASVISSSPSIATQQHGLTSLGRTQAQQAGSTLASLLPPLARVALYSSPYLRAVETAEEVRQRLRLRGRVQLCDELRERWFGVWDGGSTDGYPAVWARDAEDEGHEDRGVESVQAVMARVAEWVLAREAEDDGEAGERSIVLVSHGDTLQIAQAWFMGRSGREHRSVPHLHNAEVRRMVFAPTPA